MSAHTPGPWSIASKHGLYQDEIAGPSGNAIASVWTRRAAKFAGEAKRTPVEDWPEGMANARLVASAPELLEAAQEVLDYLGDDQCGPLLACDDPESGIHGIRDVLHAAIAKAEGR
jgi:hypothetical protein